VGIVLQQYICEGIYDGERGAGADAGGYVFRKEKEAGARIVPSWHRNVNRFI